MELDPMEKKSLDIERAHRSLTNQTPSPEQVTRIELLREHAKDMATALISSTPPSRERSQALTHLEDSTMWGVKAIILEE